MVPDGKDLTLRNVSALRSTTSENIDPPRPTIAGLIFNVLAGRWAPLPAVGHVEEVPPDHHRPDAVPGRPDVVVGRLGDPHPARRRLVHLARNERMVAVGVPVEQRTDVVVRVGYVAIHRHHVVHHYRAHAYLLTGFASIVRRPRSRPSSRTRAPDRGGEARALPRQLSYVVNQVRDRRRVLCFPRDELNIGAHAVEQASARYQDDGGEVQTDLVEQPSVQELPPNVRPAVDLNVLRAGGFSCLLQGHLDPVGDEDVRGATLFYDRLGGTMGDNETRSVERWLLTPRTDAEIYHPASQDQRADLTEEVGLEGLDVGRRLPSEHPLVQALAADPQMCARTNLGSRDEPVQRHAHVQDNLAHTYLLVDRCFHRWTTSRLSIIEFSV